MRSKLLALGLALTATAAMALDAPILQITYSPAGGTLTLDWSAVDGATGYKVYSSNDPYGAGALLVELGSEVLSLDVTGGDQFFYIEAIGPDLPEAAPAPAFHEDEDVIGIFTDAFPQVAGTDFYPYWGQPAPWLVAEVDLDGNNTLEYQNFIYQGVQLAAPQDASLFDFLHVQLYTEDESEVRIFPISQTTGEQPFSMIPTPGVWNTYNIPLSHFTDLGLGMGDIHQFKFDMGTGGTIYVDDLFFWKEAASETSDATLADLTVDGVTVPGFNANTLSYNIELPLGTMIVPPVDATPTQVAATYMVNPAGGLPGTTTVDVTAPDMTTMLTYSVNFTVELAVPTEGPTPPTVPADSVFSIYSDVYTDLLGTNFAPYWGQPIPVVVTVDHLAGSENVLRYENLSYQGTNLGSTDGGAAQDVSGYGYLNVDLWSADATTIDFYLISLTTGERVYSIPVTQESWNNVQIPLSAYSDQGLLMSDIHQFKIVDPVGGSTVYFDNWFFAGTAGGGPVEPVPAGPAPDASYGGSSVISVYSDYHANTGVDTYRTGWSQATLDSYGVAPGDSALKYTNLVFVGIEATGANLIDASAMTHFRFDIWTPDATPLPDVFKVKLVDWGADMAFGGGDDTEHELIFDANSTPALVSENWISFDIPLTDFVNLAATDHIAQIIFSGDPNTVYVDNILFHD